MNETLAYLLSKTIIEFYYGSYVYGTTSANSDKDLICIVSDDTNFDFSKYENSIYEIEYNNYDYQFMPLSKFNEMKINHHIHYLETLGLDNKFIIKGQIEPIELDLIKVRKTISSICSNSWVKCKKKLDVNSPDFDVYRAKKSLWHVLRLYNFGIQLGTYGKIMDFSAMNSYYYEIMNNPSINWEDYKSKYQNLRNQLHTKFVKLCPKL